MRSIRLSLIIYFAVLLTAALTAVSWFAYETTGLSLEERRQAAQDLIADKFQERTKELYAARDHQLLLRAQTLAGMARQVQVHHEYLYPLGALGAVGLGMGHWPVDLWLMEA